MAGKANNKRNWAMIGMIVSSFYAFAVMAVMGILHGQFFSALGLLKPNEIGDLLSGVFAPLAFLWLFIATMLQGQELQENRLVMEQQANAAKEQAGSSAAQVAALSEQVAFLKQQTEIAAEAAEANKNHFGISYASTQANWQLSLFDKRSAVYADLQQISWDMNMVTGVDHTYLKRLAKVANDVRFLFGAEMQSWVTRVQHLVDTAVQAKSESEYYFDKQANGGLVGNDPISLRQSTLLYQKTESELKEELSWVEIEKRFGPLLKLPETIEVGDDRS